MRRSPEVHHNEAVIDSGSIMLIRGGVGLMIGLNLEQDRSWGVVQIKYRRSCFKIRNGRSCGGMMCKLEGEDCINRRC